MNFLIVYEEVPERTQIYSLSTVDHELIPKLMACHRQLIGSVNCPEEVEDFLCNLDLDKIAEKIFDTEDEESVPSVIDGKFHVVVTGQLM